MRCSSLVCLLPLLGCPASDPAGDDDGPPVTHTDPPDSEPVVEDSDSPAPPDTDPPSGEVAWTVGAAVACADPAARAAHPFTLHAPGGDWARQPVDPASDSLFVGAGLAVADFTGDGLLDLMISSRGADFRLWVQGPGLTLTDGTDRLPPMPERTAGVTPVDFDGDGDLDAAVAVFRGPTLLLHNDGTGRFTDVAADVGLVDPEGRRSISTSWADVDGDGDLDAFVAGYGRLNSPNGLPPGDPSSLLLQQADGTFVETVGPASPAVLREGHTFMGAFTDVDLDGTPDLYLVNDFGWTYPSMILRNRGGGAFLPLDVGAELARENMGLGIGDLNGDEIPDFLVTAWSAYGLFVSDGAGAWFDETRARSLRPEAALDRHVAWGNELADVDDDGDLDAAVVFGYLAVQQDDPDPERQPDALYLQDADGTFHDVARDWGVADDGLGRGLALVDLDRNGFLDWIKTDLQGPTKIYLGACDASAWLEVSLAQPGPNRFAIGARVRVGLGDRVLVREVRAGGTGYGGGPPPEVHFGLGDVDTVDFVEVVWPDGTTSRRDDVPTRRRVLVERG